MREAGIVSSSLTVHANISSNERRWCMNKYDKIHIQNLAKYERQIECWPLRSPPYWIQNLAKYERQIEALFAAAAQDAANIALFSWSDYPLALAKI